MANFLLSSSKQNACKPLGPRPPRGLEKVQICHSDADRTFLGVKALSPFLQRLQCGSRCSPTVQPRVDPQNKVNQDHEAEHSDCKWLSSFRNAWLYSPLIGVSGTRA